MKALITSFILLKIIVLHSQTYTLKQMNLKGAVKSVKELYIKVAPNEENDTIFKIVSYFNKKGKMTVTNNTFFTSEFETQSIYKYKNDTLITVVTKRIDTSDTINHNKIEDYLKITYPKKDRIIITKINSDGDKELIKKVDYKNDKIQQVKSKIYKQTEFITELVLSYNYDKNGDVIEIKESKQGDIFKINYIQYDSKNNWIKAKTIEPFSDYFYISKRTINYY